ncbi:hypothetical protein ABZ490_03640 [Streptomyces sp. NPDC005811]|uniref:hypothetical protein n=1 Tax=Streptomyces sp. NPDC005811 TaxID=3154565 RepID=UPI00340F5FB6
MAQSPTASRPPPAMRPHRDGAIAAFTAHTATPSGLLDAEPPLAWVPFPQVPDYRHTTRGQLNYAVPEDLQLQHRIHRYNADSSLQHGDITALALDVFLRAQGYPPELTQEGPK